MITATWRGRFAAASALNNELAELICLVADYANRPDSKMKKLDAPGESRKSPAKSQVVPAKSCAPATESQAAVCEVFACSTAFGTHSSVVGAA
jgi:hypothetical protein